MLMHGIPSTATCVPGVTADGDSRLEGDLPRIL